MINTNFSQTSSFYQIRMIKIILLLDKNLCLYVLIPAASRFTVHSTKYLFLTTREFFVDFSKLSSQVSNSQKLTRSAIQITKYIFLVFLQCFTVSLIYTIPKPGIFFSGTSSQNVMENYFLLFSCNHRCPLMI